jgi:hypothetical protein
MDATTGGQDGKPRSEAASTGVDVRQIEDLGLLVTLWSHQVSEIFYAAPKGGPVGSTTVRHNRHYGPARRPSLGQRRSLTGTPAAPRYSARSPRPFRTRARFAGICPVQAICPVRRHLPGSSAGCLRTLEGLYTTSGRTFVVNRTRSWAAGMRRRAIMGR